MFSLFAQRMEHCMDNTIGCNEKSEQTDRNQIFVMQETIDRARLLLLPRPPGQQTSQCRSERLGWWLSSYRVFFIMFTEKQNDGWYSLCGGETICIYPISPH